MTWLTPAMREHPTCPDDDADLVEILRFALTYNGYTRLAAGPGHLRPIVESVLESMGSGDGIPDWAGLHLLRGALFFLQRMTHHWGYVPPAQEAHMRTLVAAIRRLAGERQLESDDLP